MSRHFPAFDDQAQLHDGSTVVLVKKATLAVGEIRRLAGSLDPAFMLAGDFPEAVAPVDNVIPAMLVLHGVLQLSPSLKSQIESGTALERGPREAELRAVALTACEQIVAAGSQKFTALELGYYLWRSGKDPSARQFPRHHTKDTVFY
jgi:hypothetical protein